VSDDRWTLRENGPDVRLQFHPLPWTWRLSFWRDDVHPFTGRVQVGPFAVEAWA
jgi:hypothetical protein